MKTVLKELKILAMCVCSGVGMILLVFMFIQGASWLSEHFDSWLILRKTPKQWFDSGMSHLNQREYADAIRDLERATKLKPDDEAAWYFLGDAYNGQGAPDKAIAALQHAVELKPKDADAWYALGNAYNDKEAFPDAALTYQKGIKVNPNDADLWYALGDTYSSLGRYNDAVVAYKEAIRLKPDDADAWHYLGYAYASLGNFSDANSILDHLRKLDLAQAKELTEEIGEFQKTPSIEAVAPH